MFEGYLLYVLCERVRSGEGSHRRFSEVLKALAAGVSVKKLTSAEGFSDVAKMSEGPPKPFDPRLP